MLLISGCLFGLNCRYKGDNKKLKQLKKLQKKYLLIPVCPEQLGGLSTPRPPSYFIEGDGKDTIAGENNLINEQGENVSKHFRKGAYEVLKVCKQLNITKALFKERSPACGVNKIFLGEKLTAGRGVTSFLLLANGLTVLSEKQYTRMEIT